ncbi:DMT family transporter [Pectobacterium cacticida]
MRTGIAYGVLAVLGWAIFNVSSKAALSHGFLPNDLTMMRYGVSGLFCIPLLWRAGLSNAGGLGWPRAILLAFAAGPLFGQLVNMAVPIAPLSHTSIMVPAVSMLGGMVTGHFILKERVSAQCWIGATVMGGGLLWLMIQGGGGQPMPRAWAGDLLFVLAGFLWTAYTLMLRHWNVDPVSSVAVVNVLSGFAYLPIYLITGHGQPPHVSLGWFAGTAVLQGIVAALLTVYAYARSVQILGASRAVVLPAMVPPVALIIGAVTIHDIPTRLQVAAVAIAMIGFMGAVGAWPAVIRGLNSLSHTAHSMISRRKWRR